jgi:hypothetical protein
MNVMNLGNTKTLRTTVGITAKVGAIVRIGATAEAKIIRKIGKIRETKKPCSTRDTTRWNKKANI